MVEGLSADEVRQRIKDFVDRIEWIQRRIPEPRQPLPITLNVQVVTDAVRDVRLSIREAYLQRQRELGAVAMSLIEVATYQPCLAQMAIELDHIHITSRPGAPWKAALSSAAGEGRWYLEHGFDEGATQ